MEVIHFIPEEERRKCPLKLVMITKQNWKGYMGLFLKNLEKIKWEVPNMHFVMKFISSIHESHWQPLWFTKAPYKGKITKDIY